MLAGQYVRHDGADYQVVKIAAEVPGYVKGAPTVYYLLPLVGEQTLTFLTAPTAEELRLGPACAVCDLAPGFSRCAVDGVHHVLVERAQARRADAAA